MRGREPSGPGSQWRLGHQARPGSGGPETWERLGCCLVFPIMRHFPSGLARTEVPTNSQIVWRALRGGYTEEGWEGKFIRLSTLGTGHTLFPHLGPGWGGGVVRGWASCTAASWHGSVFLPVSQAVSRHIHGSGLEGGVAV